MVFFLWPLGSSTLRFGCLTASVFHFSSWIFIFHCSFSFSLSSSCLLDRSQFFFVLSILFPFSFFFKKELKAKQGKIYWKKNKGWYGGKYLEMKTMWKWTIIKICNRRPTARFSYSCGLTSSETLGNVWGHFRSSKIIGGQLPIIKNYLATHVGFLKAGKSWVISMFDFVPPKFIFVLIWSNCQNFTNEAGNQDLKYKKPEERPGNTECTSPRAV